MKIPRKKKKELRKVPERLDTFAREKFTWHFHRRMHLTRNYILAGIDIDITPERLQWIKNGLLLNNWKQYDSK